MFKLLLQFFEKITNIIPRFHIIQPNEMGVTVTLGKISRVLKPGWWIWWPAITQLDYMEVIDQIQPLDELSVTLESMETILLQPSIRYKIVDIVAAFYKVQDLNETLYTHTKAKLRHAVSEYSTFEDVNTDMDNILSEVTKSLRTDALHWGVEVHNIQLTDFAIHKVHRILGQPSPIIEQDEEL